MKLSDKLYLDILKTYKPNLTEDQIIKLKQACQKSVDDNPNMSYSDLLKGSKIYLNFIIDFPHLSI